MFVCRNQEKKKKKNTWFYQLSVHVHVLHQFLTVMLQMYVKYELMSSIGYDFNIYIINDMADNRAKIGL